MTTGFSGLLVNHAALDQMTIDIRSAVQAIGGRLDQLEAELAPLRSEWSGQAQDSYRISKLRWDGAISQMRDLLNQTGAGVNQANASYAQADRAAAATFSQI